MFASTAAPSASDAVGATADFTATNTTTSILNSQHLDYITNVAFDTYGRRMATCAGDRVVRIWDLQDDGSWAVSAQWQAHKGSVTDVCWAHPEFGSLIATCGSDHEAKIWEERSTHTASHAAPNSNAAATAVRWNLKASITEARRAVTCCEFAPRHWGLKLAVGSADGCIRIYEALDVMNLAQWPLAATIPAFVTGEENKSSNTQGSAMLTTGTSSTTTTASNKLGCTCLSWSTGRFEPPTLVVGGSHLVVYRYSDTAREWKSVLQLSSATYDVLDVAWAPNVGRRFHYIASAEGEELRIFKLARDAPGSSSSTEMETSGKEGATGGAEKRLALESSQTIPTNAWRCQWNVTGTVLASSGDAGMVQLWKANHGDGQFQCVSKVQGDLTRAVAASDAT